jgi:universal stress protein A
MLMAMEWKTLLVPHDYSPCADRAVALAADLARHHGARIVLAHVTDLHGLTADALVPDRESGQMVRADAYARAEATRELERRADSLRAAELPVDIAIGFGDVADQILELAGETKADVIVMGTHGRTGLAHMLIGSMTEKVLRRASVPVLTVRDRDEVRRTTSEMVVTDLATD